MSDSIKFDSGAPPVDTDESSTERTLLRTSVARELSGDGFGSVKVLSHEAADRVFTAMRREIISLLNNREVSSQREIARLLDRDPGAVKRDLEQLAKADLLTIEQAGRSKRPTLKHDTIVVEPLAAPDSAIPEASYTVENEP